MTTSINFVTHSPDFLSEDVNIIIMMFMLLYVHTYTYVHMGVKTKYANTDVYNYCISD